MRGRRRPPEERVSSVAGPLPPCRVCGEEAAGYHYGVNTCEACKGFFRRSLLRNGEYECTGSGSCVIGQNRRKCCPQCRYLKCLSVGMSKDAIKTGRYTYMKRTQDTLELKRLKHANQTLISDLIMENDCSSYIVAEPSTYSFEQRSPHISVNDADSLISNSCCSFSPDIESSQDISSVSKPVSPSISAASPSLTELMPNLSAELMSMSPYVSQKNTLKMKRIEELKNTAGLPGEKCHNSLKPLSPTSVTCNPNLRNLQCSKLLSPLLVDEDSDFSQGSERLVCQHSLHSSRTSSLAAEMPSSSSCSSFSSSVSPSPLQQEYYQRGLNGWHVYSETELDELISVIVSGHKMHVEDANSVSDEVLQKMFRECKERCSLQTEIFGHLGVIKKDEHDQIYASTGLDVDGRLDDLSYAAQNMDIYVRQMISFMKLIPGFRSLSLSDQTALVKASMSDLFMLGYFRGYNRDDLIIVEANRSYCKHQMMVFNSEEDLDTVFIIAQRLQNLNLTFEMVVVLKALCIFFSDRATLEEPDAVEQLQLKIVQSLLLLLRRHYAHSKSLMFARILSILALIRNHAEDCHKFVIQNFLSGSYMERFYKVPIIFEFLHAHLSC